MDNWDVAFAFVSVVDAVFAAVVAQYVKAIAGEQKTEVAVGVLPPLSLDVVVVADAGRKSPEANSWRLQLPLDSANKISKQNENVM